MRTCHQTLLPTTLLLFIALAVLPASAFYNPTTGRWLSRDPIEEVVFYESYLHLASQLGLPEILRIERPAPYVFINNRPISSSDILGLYQVSFEIITNIRRAHGWTVPSSVLGEKTRHWVTVETDTGEIVTRGESTGLTWGILPTLSGYNETAYKRGCMMFVNMSGYGQQLANPFLEAINWDFEFEIDIDKNKVKIKKGQHDGFPSYQAYYGPESYTFDEISPDRLDDPMEITIP